MRASIAVAVAASFLAACAGSSGPNTASQQPMASTSRPAGAVSGPGSAGVFTFSGLNRDNDKPQTVQWRYGLKLRIDPTTVSQITLSCPPIPGTSVGIKGPLSTSGGAVDLLGPQVPVSPASTPWLYDKTDTYSVCTAHIARTGGPDVDERTTVRMTADQKAALLARLGLSL